jgi:hypothetical protein
MFIEASFVQQFAYRVPLLFWQFFEVLHPFPLATQRPPDKSGRFSSSDQQMPHKKLLYSFSLLKTPIKQVT